MKRNGFTYLALAAMIASPAFAATPRDTHGKLTPAQRQTLDGLDKDVNVVLDDQDVPSYLLGNLSARQEMDPVAEAANALRVHGAAFRARANDGFTYRVHENDQIGQTHVRMTQTYKGVPVVGGELIVHLSADKVKGINGRFVADLDLDVTPHLTAPQAASQATNAVAREGQVLDVAEVGSAVIFEGRLSIPVKVAYTDEGGLGFDEVFVDANNGAVLGRHAKMYTAKSRSIYNFNQTCISTGNEFPGTFMFSEGGSSADTGAMGAYNGTGTTYDFYKAIFNRDSYDNAGAVIKSGVHAQFQGSTSCTKNNAAWFDTPYAEMAYGDGDGTTFTQLALSLDVTAHELTHAVCSRTANLTYAKESGALNEANSDILGEATAFWNGTGDWKIGAEVYTPGTAGDALRYFSNPTQDGYSADYYPERLYSGTCTASNSNDQCGVHGNSGIANLFFYLLSQGGTHPRAKTTVSVTGIGITAAQAIWYRALSTYMTASTNFQGARTATSSAAADLYGGSCSTTWQTVNKAWDAVGVPGTWSCGGTTYSIAGNAGTAGATVTAGSSSTTADASGNYTISSLAAGTYTVSASKSGCTFSPTSQSVTVGPNATGKNFTATCGSSDVTLTSGVGYSDSVAVGAWKYYTINVPAGATNLTVATTGATGDVDLFTQSGAKPTATTYVCRPYTASGNESCSQANPAAGAWWFGVNGYAAGSYTITATITTGTVTYSIAGNAGTASATVTAGTASATADASGNYSIAGLAAGTYTVSASKSGCTFSPTSQSVTVGPSATGKNFTATCGGGGQVERLLNGTFESLTASTNTAADGSWTRSAFTGTSFNTLIAAGTAPHGGTDYAYLGVNNSASQTLDSAATAIPSGATSATLSFYVSIVTSETGTTVYDTLKIQLVDASTNAVLSTLATLSNVNSTGAATTYVLKSYDVTAQKGKSVKVRFLATTDSSLTTSFRLDDVSLKSDG